MKQHYSAFILAAALLLFGCTAKQPTPIQINGLAQGSYYSVTYFDNQNRLFRNEIDSLLDDFDLTASLWVDNSLIRRVNDNGDSIVNDLFAHLLSLSVEMNTLTDGAFDCTVGNLVNAWGFGFSNREDIDDNTIDSLLQYVGQQPTVVARDGQNILRKPHPSTTIDFNAIAQGYSTDLLCRFLDSKGIDNYIVDIGGEIFAKGCKPDGKPWRVGIERPASDKDDIERHVETTISLSNSAVVTSGSYRKYYEHDGTRYSHTIDPATGRPVVHTLLSVSVVDSSAWRADALATAFMVMGLDKAIQFINSHPDDPGTKAVFFIYNVDGQYRTYATEGFRALIQE